MTFHDVYVADTSSLITLLIVIFALLFLFRIMGHHGTSGPGGVVNQDAVLKQRIRRFDDIDGKYMGKEMRDAMKKAVSLKMEGQAAQLEEHLNKMTDDKLAAMRTLEVDVEKGVISPQKGLSALASAVEEVKQDLERVDELSKERKQLVGKERRFSKRRKTRMRGRQRTGRREQRTRRKLQKDQISEEHVPKLQKPAQEAENLEEKATALEQQELRVEGMEQRQEGAEIQEEKQEEAVLTDEEKKVEDAVKQAEAIQKDVEEEGKKKKEEAEKAREIVIQAEGALEKKLQEYLHSPEHSTDVQRIRTGGVPRKLIEQLDPIVTKFVGLNDTTVNTLLPHKVELASDLFAVIIYSFRVHNISLAFSASSFFFFPSSSTSF